MTRPIADIADSCEDMMKPSELITWEYWWAEVVQEKGELPPHKTYAYLKWIEKRCDLKIAINKELGRRKSPRRLICPGMSKGIYLASENDIAEITADTRLKKIANCIETASKEWRLLANCKGLPIHDKEMMSRLSNLMELQQNTMIGTMVNMDSLPAETKQRLLKKLGFNNKKID